MGKYFGTDGVRGEANVELTPELAFKLGRFGGYVLSQHETETPRVFVARDTRISGQMLESALVAGLLSAGIHVYKLGVLATPGVAHLVKTEKASAGVMISASHNPAQDNGIKFFAGDGFKLDDDLEAEIEALLDAEEDSLPRPSAQGLGDVVDYPEGLRKYQQFLVSTGLDLEGLKVALDTANGAAATSARQVFVDLGADLTVMAEQPDGLNINEGVGSTHPEKLQELVKETGSQIGLAFDGDSDRLIAVDENGDLVDGDRIMYIIGKYLSDKGLLAQNTIVTTVMSNLGLYKSLEREGIDYEQTAVGDKYVAENMMENNYSIGGDQSGHIIFSRYSATGDGILTSLMIMEACVDQKATLCDLAKEMKVYPQLLRNVRVSDKKTALENEKVKAAIEAAAEALGDDGRILVRESGTEPLIRVMVEAGTDDLCHKYVDSVVDVMEAEGLVVE